MRATSSSSAADAAAERCAEEPIHIPGSIQPRGYLFVLGTSGEILQASENAASLFGVDVAELLGTRIIEWLASYESSWNLKSALSRLGDEREVSVEIELPHEGGRAWFHAIAHQTSAGTIVEFEPVQSDLKIPATDTAPILRSVMNHLEEARSVLQLCEVAAREVRHLTGFDRVKVYQFDDDWHGEVIAEERADHMEAYLHHHFPASDIPAQARRLYEVSPVRMIADAHYRAVPVVPDLNPLTNAPLDMSHCVLRSVSPVHIEYLKNMQVGASMSVSLLRNGRLWGLIACHHAEPHYVPFPVRAACQLIGQIVSLLLREKEEAEAKSQVIRARTHMASLLRALLRSNDVAGAIAGNDSDLLNVMNAGGACIVDGEEMTTVGAVPDREPLQRLIRWILDKYSDDIFATAALSTDYEQAADLRAQASGVFALPLGAPTHLHLVWLRQELPQTVKWAGNPEKRVSEDTEASPGRLHPRQSFSAWEQALRGRSLPWTNGDREVAERLRSLVAEVLA